MVDFAFLDSGTGGIPYMLTLKEKFPQCTCLYLGDTKHFPYGEKNSEDVISCASDAINLIIKNWNPKTIVIACNTISVTALDSLRKIYSDIPIVGTVPAIKLASKVSENKRIGLLATNATVNHPYCENLIKLYAADCHVISRGDPELISFIEKNLFIASKEEKLNAVKKSVEFFKENNCDTIILGCTHFTHIADEIKEIAGENIKVIDSREGVVNQAIKVELDKNSFSKKTNNSIINDMSFFVTSATELEKEEYLKMCSSLNIPWGGILYNKM
ncbi:MAG: glutamate racemase [Treponema sp.]|nr:glutamate racemase [Treponema sp.]